MNTMGITIDGFGRSILMMSKQEISYLIFQDRFAKPSERPVLILIKRFPKTISEESKVRHRVEKVENKASFIPPFPLYPRDGEPSFIFSKDLINEREWSDGNISTLIHVLKCFFHASGLKINLNKSKIMGINVESAQVIQAAAKLGLVLKCPFYYLGTRVGGSMTRVQAMARD
ncbi:hypothetical protein Tco_0593834 [Tanacetum coccineum]